MMSWLFLWITATSHIRSNKVIGRLHERKLGFDAGRRQAIKGSAGIMSCATGDWLDGTLVGSSIVPCALDIARYNKHSMV